MKILIKREVLRRAISSVIGVVDKKQTMPILGHVLLEKNDESLKLTTARIEFQHYQEMIFHYLIALRQHKILKLTKKNS